MSMETGVDGGSALVPEVVWLSSDSMRVVGGFIMLGCMFMVMPGASGISGMEGCGFWAMRYRGDERTSERKIAGRMRGMTGISPECAVAADGARVRGRCEAAVAQEEIRCGVV
jgi:hypothetical protein